jgi:hypothetical protein
MTRTIAIQNSDEVMAMYGIPGTFYRGKWERIKVTQIGEDEDTPLKVRKSLVGLIIPTIFTKESIEGQTGITFPIPNESRLAYSPDVIEALRLAQRHEAAEQLARVAPSPLDMYVFEREIYELV